MTTEGQFDLKQVSALFNNCIAHVRSRQISKLDAEAATWLNKARVDLMKKIESSFYILAKAADNPLSLPLYAIDPQAPLRLEMLPWAPVLGSYRAQFKENIQRLMDECGFNACVADYWAGPTMPYPHLTVEIKFPDAILPASKQSRRQKLNTDVIKSFNATILKITAASDEEETTQEQEKSGPSTGNRQPTKKATKRERKKTSGAFKKDEKVIKQEPRSTGPARKRRRADPPSEEEKNSVLGNTSQQYCSSRVTRSISSKMVTPTST